MINEELRKILVCPQCKGKLEYQEARIICPACRKYYPILSGIPALRPEDARDLPADEPAT